MVQRSRSNTLGNGDSREHTADASAAAAAAAAAAAPAAAAQQQQQQQQQQQGECLGPKRRTTEECRLLNQVRLDAANLSTPLLGEAPRISSSSSSRCSSSSSCRSSSCERLPQQRQQQQQHSLHFH
ncbi:hypothetical protein Emag_004998 [Eimeria magna]